LVGEKDILGKVRVNLINSLTKWYKNFML
jgi:hypothetical protein